MYTFRSRVRYSEIDENRTLSLLGLVNYMQDCSTFHSDSIGRGLEVLSKADYAWVLNSWQIVVERYPVLGEEIEICTWPYEFKGFLGGRNFQIRTLNGEILAYANSIWSFLDVKTGKPTRAVPEEVDAYHIEEKMDMYYAPRKIAIPEGCEEQERFVIQRHHLDTNHHVNNAQYIFLAENYLPAGFAVGQIRAEYKKQALLGDVIVPKVLVADQVCIVVLCNKEDQVYATVEFRTERQREKE